MFIAPGFSVVPFGAYLPQEVDMIWSSRSPEVIIAEALSALGRPQRRLSSLSINDVVAIGDLPKCGIPRSSRTHKAIVRVLANVLADLGIIKQRPLVVEYRQKPTMTIDEVLDRMVANLVKPLVLATMGGEHATIETLAAQLPTWLREMGRIYSMRSIYLTRLRQHLGDIAFRLGNRASITQHERSFFVQCADPSSPYGVSAMDGTPQNPAAARPDVFALEHGSTLVAETWAAYCAAVGSGPHSAYVRMNSNTNMENLIYTYGPHVSSLTVMTAYAQKVGDFVELTAEPIIKWPWDADATMTAVTERIIPALGSASSQFGFKNPTLFTTPNPVDAPAFDMILDDPDLRLEPLWKKNGDKVLGFEVGLYSPSRGRELIFDSTAGAALMQERALTTSSHGGGGVANLDVIATPFIDWGLSESRLMRKIDFNAEYQEEIILPDPAKRSVQKRDVDMAQFYRRHDIVCLKPALSEYVLPPLHWLNVPDPEAEAFIAQRLSMTVAARKQAEMAIRLSHNAARLKKFLGVTVRPNLDQYIKATLGY